MDERTEILVCVAASVALNCVECLEHYYKRACAAGISSDTIEDAVDHARKVQNGAHLALRVRTEALMKSRKNDNLECCSGSTPSKDCCS